MKSADGKIKKISLIFAVILMTVFMSNNIFAAEFSVISVGGNGSTGEKINFGWEEIPWLYAQLPGNGIHVTSAWWTSPDSVYYVTPDVGFEKDIWLSLDEGLHADGSPVTSWNDVREAGEWNINMVYTSYENNMPYSLTDTASFTVTPEPISYILFLAGGGTLACRRFWGKKKVA